jgi:hypothetical protein
MRLIMMKNIFSRIYWMIEHIAYKEVAPNGAKNQVDIFSTDR